MATVITILSKSAIKRYDNPPQFSGEERKVVGHLPLSVQTVVETMESPHNKLGFILQYVYFKVTNRFYSVELFNESDIHAFSRRYKLGNPDLGQYSASVLSRHREQICNIVGYKRFDKVDRNRITLLSNELCQKQIRPRQILIEMIDTLTTGRVELPSYQPLAKIISESLNRYEEGLIYSISKRLTPSDKEALSSLIEPVETEEKKNYPVSRLVFISHFIHTRGPKAIRENCQKLLQIQKLLIPLTSVIKELDITSETVNYYARIALSYQSFQLERRDESRYLYLLCFLIHQNKIFQDRLIEILIWVCQKSESERIKHEKENVYISYKFKSNELSKIEELGSDILLEMALIFDTDTLTDLEKLSNLRQLYQEKIEVQKQSKDSIAAKLVEQDIPQQRQFFNSMEKRSRFLQDRLNELVKRVTFEKSSSDSNLYEALLYFKKKEGQITSTAPTSFMSSKELDNCWDANGKLRIQLYKVLLFMAIMKAVKSGVINLSDTYKYGSFESYLISAKRWNEEQDILLRKAGLFHLRESNGVIDELVVEYEDQFKLTHNKLLSKENKWVRFDKPGKPIIKRSPPEEETRTVLSEYFPQVSNSVFEILSTIDSQVDFTANLEHRQQKNSKKSPSQSALLGGIIGYGCNIGISRMGQMVRKMEKEEIEYATRNHFSLTNIENANNAVLNLTEKIKLSAVYKSSSKRHTSSDGQKFSVGINSLDASYSHKYFGTQKGVSIYTFIDESHKLFHSTVMTPSEREAAYVIDGLMANDVVQSEIHSTDTHGYSEIVFGVAHLLGVSFAPRIKGFKNQRMYSFEKKSIANKEGHLLLSTGRIKTELIEAEWENILRFVATIKLKESSASQLLKRLSSYSREHPLYRALKQFGRIVKTIFLLRYIDDIELRKSITKQLNKVESYHQFAKAIFFGQNQEFNYATREEQLIAEGCKRLIANSIICWNYLYLSKRICNAESPEEKREIIDAVKNGSIVTWHHINFQGEYDFSEKSLQNAVEFDFEEIMSMDLEV